MTKFVNVSFFALVVSLLLLTGAWTAVGSAPKTSASPQSLFPKKSQTLSAFQQTEREFGGGLLEVIVFKLPKDFRSQPQFDLQDLEEDLYSLEGVERVISPLVSLSKYAPPFSLVSRNGEWGRFLVEIKSDLSAAAQSRLNEKLNELVGEYANLEPMRAGSFFTAQSVAAVIEKETNRLVPFCAAVLFVVLLITFRSVRAALTALAAPGVALLLIGLTMMVLDMPLGPVSQLAPPMILAIGTSYSIHVIARLAATPVSEHKANFYELFTAIALAASTTCAGVLSLYFLDVRGVTEFALISAAGVLLSAWLSLTIPFFLLRFMNYGKVRVPSLKLDKFISGSAACGIILFAALLFTGARNISVHTDPVSFLPAHGSVFEQLSFSNSLFPGNRRLSILIAPLGDTLRPQDLATIAKLSRELRGVDGIQSVVSGADFEHVSEFQSEFSISSPDQSASYFGPRYVSDPNLRFSRIIVESDAEGADLLALRTQIDQVLHRYRSADLSFKLGSMELILAEQSEHIVLGIVQSLALTLLFVVVLLALVVRTPRAVMLGILPNIVPLASVFGIIGYLYGTMNLGASLVAAAALSIAVDNTFHILIVWRGCRRSGSSEFAAAMALERNIAAFVCTTIVLIAGFAVMTTSSVLPVSQFGLLISAALLIGLIADVVVLPYFLRRLC